MGDITRIKFDGIMVRLYDNSGNLVAHSIAVSGNPGSQNPSLQNIRNTGPLPEGNYTISPSNIDYRDSIPEYLTWSEGWGEGRVTLIPNDGTELHGRSGFFLHGSRGDNGYGSAGCIDLNTDDSRILNLLSTRGADNIEVIVDYSDNREFLENNSHPALKGNCFLAGTMISMWPLDVQPDANGNYDEKEVLAKVWKKPIEEITPNDWVLSFDKNNKLKPGKVTRTFQNDAKIILDFHGTFVTPGHVYYREDSKKTDKFEPLIDILRDDGVIKHQDGTLIRAATGCEVGSKDDEQFWAFTVNQVDGGERVCDKKQLRLGTRWMLPNGQHFSMREYMQGIGVELIEEGEFRGYVKHKKNGLITIFAWVLSDTLPNPEDFVLQRSQTSLEDIYRAGQWESQRPQLPAPMIMDGGAVQALSNSDFEQMPRNMPMAFQTDAPFSSMLPERSKNQPTMNRQQRRALERKQRKAARSQGQTLH